MASTSSITYFARFTRGALVATFVVVASVSLRGEEADACGCCDPSIVELTTFDPDVLGDAPGLDYNPYDSAFGESCKTGDCTTKALLADWHGYFGGAVTDADWQKILFEADAGALASIAQRLNGKTKSGPKGYEQSSVWKDPGAKDKLLAAITLVQLARKIEAFSVNEQLWDGNGNLKPTAAPPADLLASAKTGFKAAKDPFLVQRYAFQAIRVMFYQRDYSGLIAFYDKSTSVLGGPSNDLQWRSRYYAAGALTRTKDIARANLELARIHGNYPVLANQAAFDFKPREDSDWRAALKLAKTTREKTELWRLVGIKKDGVVAIQEILKLDPKSNLVGLLMIRELTRTESRVDTTYGPADPKDVAAQKKAYGTLEKIALAQASAAGADRPWLMELIAGHIDAKRGDLAGARLHLTRAVAGKPGDAAVASQAKASLALALALDWKINPQNEDELAKSINTIDPTTFGRLQTVRLDVRAKLAKAYAKAGKLVDAEYLKPGTVDPIDDTTGKSAGKPKWADVAFIKEMIARNGRTTTEFDKFVIKDSHTKAHLEQDLALRYLLDGDFASAAKTFQTSSASSDLLKTDPFVIHVVDCHDCDHTKFETAKWTHANFAARLVELELKAQGGGEAAAEAAFLLGNAMYNITWYGNARSVLEDSHQMTHEARAAERWYKRAYDLTKNRELKVKAAFMAAKSELGTLIGAGDEATRNYDDALPFPKTWFPIVKQYADTKYYKEILRECGNFKRFAK